MGMISLINHDSRARENRVRSWWNLPRLIYQHQPDPYWVWSSHGYGSIPIDTFLVGWTSIYQLFWGSLGTRVLTHPHIFRHSLPLRSMNVKRACHCSGPSWVPWAETSHGVKSRDLFWRNDPSYRDPTRWGTLSYVSWLMFIKYSQYSYKP